MYKKKLLIVACGAAAALLWGVGQGQAVPVLTPGIDYSFPHWAISKRSGRGTSRSDGVAVGFSPRSGVDRMPASRSDD